MVMTSRIGGNRLQRLTQDLKKQKQCVPAVYLDGLDASQLCCSFVKSSDAHLKILDIREVVKSAALQCRATHKEVQPWEILFYIIAY